MYNVTSSNLIPLCILRVLEEHSDSCHHLKQDEIARYLNSEYNLSVERKAIGRTLERLRQELDVDILSDRDGSWIASRSFEDSELRLLIDAVMSSRYMNPNYTKKLVDKLSRLFGVNFASGVKNLYTIKENVKSDNAEMFNNISLINDAISRNLKITFQYCEYGTDKKLHAHSHHTLSPYRMLLHEGTYYLIGWNEDEYEYEYGYGLRSYKIDHLKDMKVLQERAQRFENMNMQISEADYRRQIVADPVMSLEKPMKFTFYAKNYLVDDIVDYFGREITITEKDKVPEWLLGFDESVLVKVQVSYYAMRRFALEHIDTVQVIEPIELEGYLRETLFEASRRYDVLEDHYRVTQRDIDAIDDLPLQTKAAFGLPILFGTYPFTASGEEAMIEWMPLRFERGRALLISKYCIDAIVFDEKEHHSSWRDSNLRKWMNETFYAQAFTEEEKAQILTTTLKNLNHEYSQEEYETEDKVFALSVMEANCFFQSEEERRTISTDYLKGKCEKIGWYWQNSWWLRTPSRWFKKVVVVYPFGAIKTQGKYAYNKTVGVRPAIWVKR